MATAFSASGSPDRLDAGTGPTPGAFVSPALRRWLLCWVVLPNIAFCALWAIATPPRASAIVATGAIGLAVRSAPPLVRATAFVAALLYSMLSCLSAVFNLGLIDVVEATRVFAALDPLGPPAYVVALSAMALLAAAAALLCRRDMAFDRRSELIVAAVAVLAVATVDHAVSFGSRGAYKRVAPAGAPFESAVGATGLVAGLDEGRHVLVVVVEAMGSPTDPAVRRLMLEPWRRAAITDRYEVSHGTTAFNGSTVGAEMREFCGRWGDQDAVVERPDHGCLPAVAVTKGYETTAIHGFSGSFFDRERWYPNIGFQQRIFGETMRRAGLSRCDAGTCDREIPALIGRQLRSATRPQFLYWLTLNSHLPVPESDSLDTGDCARRHPEMPVGSGGLCRLISVVRATGASLAETLADPRLPPTEVLIVGDHMPPFFDHASRMQFDHGRVPWIRLRPRQPAAPRR